MSAVIFEASPDLESEVCNDLHQYKNTWYEYWENLEETGWGLDLSGLETAPVAGFCEHGNKTQVPEYKGNVTAQWLSASQRLSFMELQLN
jgi:hypothetical protein